MPLPNPGIRTHGQSKTTLYRIWGLIKHRCDNPRNPAYPRYGGRGVKLCARWSNSFEAFAADVGERPSLKHSIDRYPNMNGDYEPGNVRWATRKEQSRNRRSNRTLTIGTETRSLAEWCELYGKPPGVVLARVNRGWPVELALTAPKSYRSGAIPPDSMRWREVARAAVAAALRDGLLVKPPHCESPSCLETRLHAHHHRGYAEGRRLDVVWLCPRHHKLAAADGCNDSEQLGTYVGPYTGRQVAALLGIGESAFRHRLRKGQIPGEIAGRDHRRGFDRAVIAAWVASLRE